MTLLIKSSLFFIHSYDTALFFADSFFESIIDIFGSATQKLKISSNQKLNLNFFVGCLLIGSAIIFKQQFIN